MKMSNNRQNFKNCSVPPPLVTAPPHLGNPERGGTLIFFYILSIMEHFQRVISPELLDLNPSFIYQNTHFNVLFENAWVCLLGKFMVQAFGE